MNLHLCALFTLAVLVAVACDGSGARVSPLPSATDPIIGTWRLKVAESTFSTAMQDVPLKELTEILREIDGGRIELAQHGTQEDGAPMTFRTTYPAEGGVVTIIDAEGTDGLTFVETQVSPGNWYATTLRGGKQVIVRHKRWRTRARGGTMPRQPHPGVRLVPERVEKVLDRFSGRPSVSSWLREE